MIMYKMLDTEKIIQLHIRSSQQNETIPVNTDALPSRWNKNGFYNVVFSSLFS